MKVAFIILTILIVLLFYPIKIKANAGFNLLINEGYIGLKLGIIRLLLCDFYIGLNKIVLYNSDKTLYESALIGIGKGNNFFEILIFELMHHLRLKTFKFYAKVGYVNDAAITSLLCNFFNICLGLLSVKILYHKPKTKVLNAIYPSYCKNSCMFAGSFSLKINFFTILICIFVTIFKCIKGVVNNYGKRTSS